MPSGVMFEVQSRCIGVTTGMGSELVALIGQ